MSAKAHPEFPLDPLLIYLNHAAVAPWPVRTSAAVQEFARENSVFGASNYPRWLKKEAELRDQFKQLLNAPSTDDIGLVKNTSEALSFVASGIAWKSGDNIVSSNEEFPSNRIPWEALRGQGVEFRQADLKRGYSAEESLFDCVDSRTRMITISSIQFASGIRVDLDRIGAFCRQHGLLFCVDAIQSLGAVRFDVQACQADFVMADGHKWMLGPEGLGVFYTSASARTQLNVSQYGWHMTKDVNNYDNCPWVIEDSSRKFECGSANMLGIHALSASLSLLLETGLATVEERVLENARYLRACIQRDPALILLSEDQPQPGSGIVLFRHRRIDNHRLFDHLRSNNVICALRGGGIRFSPHFYTSRDTLQRAMDLVSRAG